MGLLGLIRFRNGSVRAILDDDVTKHGSSLEGLPILPPFALEGLSEVAILVSTLVGEEAVLSRLATVQKPGWQIKTIYKRTGP